MSNSPKVPVSGLRNSRAAAAAQEAFDDEDFESLPQPLPDEEPPAAVILLPKIAAKLNPQENSPFQEALQKAAKPVKIRVNGVGITIPSVDHHVAARSICCILKDEGWDCELPITSDVEVSINDKIYKAAYLGGFHRFPHLGIQTLYFPLPEEPVADGS